MNRLAPALMSSALFLGACSAEQADPIRPTVPATEHITTTFQTLPPIGITLEDGFSADKQLVIKNAAEQYVKVYGCARANITIGLGQFAIELDGDANTIVDAEAESGLMKLNSVELQKDTADELDNVIRHEMTHVCKPEKPLLFANPITLQDGAKALGIQGFGLLVELPDGMRTQFMKIEEGAAEAEAAAIKPGYNVGDKSYFLIGQLTRNLMKQHDITNTELAAMIQTNDLAQFVNTIGDPKQSFEVNLMSAMDLYQRTFEQS